MLYQLLFALVLPLLNPPPPQALPNEALVLRSAHGRPLAAGDAQPSMRWALVQNNTVDVLAAQLCVEATGSQDVSHCVDLDLEPGCTLVGGSAVAENPDSDLLAVDALADLGPAVDASSYLFLLCDVTGCQHVAVGDDLGLGYPPPADLEGLDPAPHLPVYRGADLWHLILQPFAPVDGCGDQGLG